MPRDAAEFVLAEVGRDQLVRWPGGRIGEAGGSARFRASAAAPPGVPWSWSGGWSRRIARAVTRPGCRDQGPIHDHGTSRGWPAAACTAATASRLARHSGSPMPSAGDAVGYDDNG